MAAITQLPSGVSYNPTTGKYQVLKGTKWVTLDATLISGLGLKVAQGSHVQAAATDTVVTGLATVVMVVASLQDPPTANIFAVTAGPGDQAGAPAAGSILLKAYKTPATPVAATVFSDNVHVAWIALGT